MGKPNVPVSLPRPFDVSTLKDYNTVPEAAAFLTLSEKSVYRKVENGDIGYTRVSQRVIRFRKQHLIDFLEANTHPAKEPSRA